MATSVADVRRAKAEGRLAVAFGVGEAWAMDGQPDLVPVYATLGVRWLLIAYNRGNAMGGGPAWRPDTMEAQVRLAGLASTTLPSHRQEMQAF